MKIVISQEGSDPITITTESSTVSAQAASFAQDYFIRMAEKAAIALVLREFPRLIKAIYTKCANYIPDINSIDEFCKHRKFIKCIENLKQKHKDCDFPTLAEVERDYNATTKSKFICDLFDSHKDPNIDAGAKSINIHLRKVLNVPVCIIRIPEPNYKKKGLKHDVLASTAFVKTSGGKIKSIPLARAEVNFRR